MKGQVFTGSLGLMIEIEGESWFQGQVVRGVLKIKNQGSENLSLDSSNMGVSLGLGDLKKVHANNEGAIKNISEVLIPAESPSSLKPQQELNLSFEFPLDTNCPITDKKSSYFISYGQGPKRPHLQLTIHPLPLFKQVAGCIESFYRFKFKEAKAAKKGVSFKFKPPGSRELTHVDNLELTAWLVQKELHLQFAFDTKKIDANSPVKAMIKNKTQYAYKLTQRDYSLGPDALNQDKILAVIGDVMDQVKLKTF